MAISRRLFLTGSLSGAGILLLSACTSPSPTPSPSRTGTPTPTPTAATTSGPQPTAFRRSTWGADPYSYGSTSVLPKGATAADRAALGRSLSDKLFFAGEAVADQDPGTVMGAHTSGLKAAASVAAVAKSGERIAVIGAGMAGATAARTLADQGFDVVVIEARHRVGGRIDGVTNSDWPIEAQLGVSTLYGDGAAALESLLSASQVTTVPFPVSTTARIGDSPTASPATPSVEAALASAVAWAKKYGTDATVADALSESGAASKLSATPDSTGVSDADRLAFVLNDVVPARTGASASTLSASALAGVGLPGEIGLVTKGFTDYITAQLANLDVLRGSNVTQIDYGNKGIGLRFVTGESLSADRVISTIPLGVLKKRKIVFNPALPAAQLAAIDRLDMGVQDVLWLRFDQRLWTSDQTVWAVLDDNAAYPLWLNLEPATGFPILVALIGGDAATKAAKLSDDQAVAAALASIGPYLDAAPSASPTPSPTPAA
jgi:monoamine oxidase